MPDPGTNNTLFGDDPLLKVPPPTHPNGEPQDAAPPDTLGQCLIFCPRCCSPSDNAGDFCGRCGARRCVSCGD